MGELVADLDRLAPLLVKAGGGAWVERLESLSTRLTQPSQQHDALEELKKLFGGMGTLNDIVLCDANKNIPPGFTAKAASEELDHLLDRIFREASLIGASAEERSSWDRAAAASKLPLRVRNAFR